jgi:hypothetical protein
MSPSSIVTLPNRVVEIFMFHPGASTIVLCPNSIGFNRNAAPGANNQTGPALRRDFSHGCRPGALDKV